MYGVQNASANLTATGNVIRNISGNSNGASVTMSGIIMGTGSTGVSTISQNTVHSLTQHRHRRRVRRALCGLDFALPATANIDRA